MNCEYCGSMNCKKHIKCICKYCNYTCFTKDTFKKHQCKAYREFELLEERYKQVIQQIYSDARQEILQIKSEKETLNTKLEHLNKQNYDLLNTVKSINTIKTLDDATRLQHAKSITDKDTEISRLSKEIEQINTDYHRKALEAQNYFATNIAELDKQTKLTIEQLNAEYTSKITKLEGQIQTITTSYQEKFKSEIQKLQDLHSEQKTELEKTYQVKLMETEKQFNISLLEKDNKIYEYSSKIGLFQHENNTYAQKIKQLNATLLEIETVYEDKIRKLQTEHHKAIQSIQEQMANTQHELSQYKSINQTIEEKYKYETVRLQNQTQFLTTENEDLKEKIENAIKKLNQINQLYTASNDTIQTMKSSLTEYEDKYKTIEKQYAELQYNYTQLMQTMTKSIQTEKRMNEELQTELRNVKSKLIDIQNIQAIIREKDTKIVDLENTMQSIRSELKTKVNELYHTHTLMTEVSASKSKLQKELEQVQTNYDRISNSAFNSNSEYMRVKQELDTIRYEKEKEILVLSEQLTQKQSDVKNLQSQLSEYENKHKDIYHMEKSIQQYKLKITELKTDLTIQESNSEKLIEKYKVELQGALEENKRMKKQLKHYVNNEN